MDNLLFVSVLKHLVTLDQRDSVLSLLSGSMEKTPSKSEMCAAVGDTGVLVQKSLLDFFSGHPSATVIEDAINHLEHMPVIRLTIAFPPSAEAVLRWKNQFCDTFGESCILDITKDEGLVGGAVVDMKGKVFRHVLADGMDGES